MPFSIEIHRRPGFVHFEFRGTASLPDFVEGVGVVETETLFWGDRCALFDLCGVDGELPPEDQVFLGELVGRNLSHLYRLASVVPPDRLTRRSETAARDMGVRLRVFTDADEAAGWLSQGFQESAPALLHESEGLRRLLDGRELS